ncbi:hypothetical protein K7I13_15040 [Brucepastera parasyntrophica]|uniref:nitroreductase family protein n=1 Tax=Brucepastera parasyntrophica TaxID=2880008 RepID=UPI00210D3BD2|nr:nitroreductase family protein [Brucepastera parasyntrophica]ULQ59746.1 hypothetical protein K7I13_15040 [Brucepastera parasyntrophica]
MDLYHSIAQRKSCRKYETQPLEHSIINEIEDAIKGFDVLCPSVPLEYRFSKKTKGRFNAEAPQYLVISGQGKAGEMENTGFLFEQLVLWLDAMEIGSVWLGSSKDLETQNTEKDIITLAFGRTTEQVHRTKDKFVRKPIGKITNAPDDVCIQAAHLAPSGVNTQPWYFEKKGGKVMVYEQKLKPPVSLMYKLSDIDMGIALCHYALACKETGKPFQFSRVTEMPAKPGYLPFGIIE